MHSIHSRILSALISFLLCGIAAAGPDINLSPSSATVEVPMGSTPQVTFDVENTGDSDLSWFLPTSDYVVTNSDTPGGPSYSWIDISDTGTELTLGDDSNTGPHSIGFGFPFFGDTYNEFRICSNGWIVFGATEFTNPLNYPMPAAGFGVKMIAFFWDNLNPGAGGNVYMKQTDSSTFIIEFDQVPFSGSSALLSCQLILKDDGNIYVMIKQAGVDDSCTIGIQENGTNGIQAVYNDGDYVNDEMAVQFIPVSDPWYTATPTSGTVEAGGSTTVTLDLDSVTAGLGTHTQVIYVTSNDSDETPSPFTLTFTVNPNEAPTAVASTTDSPTSTGSLVTISGSGSSDPDNGPEPLTYNWDYISGPVADPGPTLSTTDGWITATFTPNVQGTYVFELTVDDGALTATDQVTVLVGDVLVLDIASSATEGDGDITATVSTSRVLAGGEDLTVSLSSDDESEVQVPASVTINGGSSSATFTLSIQDDSDEDGSQTATITASATDWISATADIVVNDDDAAPEIAISGNTDFGSSEVGIGVSRTFTITNSGSGVLNLTGSPLVAITGANAADFTVSTQPSASISSGSSSDFVITFTPEDIGTRTATVTVNNNDADEGTYTFNIEGTGLEVTTPALPPADDDDDGCHLAGGSIVNLLPILMIIMGIGTARFHHRD